MRRCERCGTPTHTTIGSYFNTQMICMSCEAKERKHPEYERAKEIELQQCLAGNLNFEGVGLPEDLKCCLLYTSPSPRDEALSRMPSAA